jgi:hypothetical protein
MVVDFFNSLIQFHRTSSRRHDIQHNGTHYNDIKSKYTRNHDTQHREYYRGKYHCTIDLLFDWFGLVCFVNKNKNCQESYSWFQTIQKGGQQYSDTSPFSILAQHYETLQYDTQQNDTLHYDTQCNDIKQDDT